MQSRRLRQVFLVLVVGAGALIPASPAWTAGASACDPGNNCTGFESARYWVDETSRYVDLHVYAAWCCPVGQGQIDYETFDLSAKAGHDFIRSSGTLTYAGHGSGKIRVGIIRDERSEGEEQFEVRLTNFRGTFVNRGVETAVVTISDDVPEELTEISPSGPAGRPAAEPPSQPHAASTAGSPGEASVADAGLGPTDAGDVAADLQPGNRTPVVRQADPDGRVTFTGQEVPDKRRAPLALIAVLGALLLLTMAAVGFYMRQERVQGQG